MALGTTVSRLTGLGRLAALTFAVGVAESRLPDSYNIANTLPNVIYELVLGGVLTSVFIPVLVQELRTKPHQEAWDAVSRLVTTSMIVLVAISAMTMVMAPWVIRIFSSALSGAEAAQQQVLATFFLRTFAAQIALYGFAAIASGLLNAHNRFAVPVFVPILNNLVVIASLLVFAASVRGTPTAASVNADLGQKLLLGLGTTAGVAVMAAANWPFLRRLPGRIQARVDFRHPAVRKLARLSTWTIAYVVVNQIGFGISLYLANQEQGGPTTYATAFALFQLPYGIVAASIMTALVPGLAAFHVNVDQDAFRSRIASGLRSTTLLMLPATAAYLVLSRPLIETLLQHGVMSSRSSALVASTLAYFAIGLLPFSAYLLFLRGFYARQDARTPLLVNVVENAVTVVLDFVLFPSMGVRGLALAHSLGYVAGSIPAGILLGRRIGGLEGRRTIVALVKAVAMTTITAAAMILAAWMVGAILPAGGQRALVQMVLAGTLGLTAAILSARVLRIEEGLALCKVLLRR